MRLPFFKKNIISLDLGAYETKLVEASLKNKDLRVKKSLSFPTPKNAYEDGYILDENLLNEAIKDNLSTNRVKSRDAYLTVKSSAIFTREVSLPILKEDELDGILKYQLDEYLPVDTKDYVTQYRLMDTSSDGRKMQILLVATPKEIIEGHLSLVKGLDLNPLVLDFQSNSAIKYLVRNGINDGTYALVDLGFDSTNTTILRNGRIQVSRTIDIGGGDIDEAILNFFDFSDEELELKKENLKYIDKIDEKNYTKENRIKNIVNKSIEKIMAEIDSVFMYYTSREAGNAIESIYLYGGLSNIDGIEKLFENHFNIPTIKLGEVGGPYSDNLHKYINCLGTLVRDGGA